MAGILSRLTSILRSKEDEEITQLVNNSWRTLRVVGRGTLRVDPEEVRNSPEFKDAMKRLESLFQNQQFQKQ